MSETILDKITKHTSAQTRKTYGSNMRALFGQDYDDEKTVKLLKDNIDKIISDKIVDSGMSVSTKMARSNVLAVVVREVFPDNKDLFAKVSALRDSFNKKYEDDASTNKKQLDVDNDMYMKLIKRLEPQALNAMKTYEMADANVVQQYMVLLMYFYHALRLDISNMKFYTNGEPEDKGMNYIVYNKRKWVMYLYEFKTKRSGKQRLVIPLHKNITKAINAYFKYVQHIRPDNDYFIWNYVHDKPLSENQLSRYYNDIFTKYLKKHFTVTDNRRRFASADPDVQSLIAAKQRVDEKADAMGTSADMLVKVYNQTGKK